MMLLVLLSDGGLVDPKSAAGVLSYCVGWKDVPADIGSVEAWDSTMSAVSSLRRRIVPAILLAYLCTELATGYLSLSGLYRRHALSGTSSQYARPPGFGLLGGRAVPGQTATPLPAGVFPPRGPVPLFAKAKKDADAAPAMKKAPEKAQGKLRKSLLGGKLRRPELEADPRAGVMASAGLGLAGGGLSADKATAAGGGSGLSGVDLRGLGINLKELEELAGLEGLDLDETDFSDSDIDAMFDAEGRLLGKTGQAAQALVGPPLGLDVDIDEMVKLSDLFPLDDMDDVSLEP